MKHLANKKELAEHLKILDQIQLDKSLDYETIGKMVVAGILHQQEHEMRSQRPDSNGHIRLDANLRYTVGVDVKPQERLCCWCYIQMPENIPICHGDCCGKVMQP